MQNVTVRFRPIGDSDKMQNQDFLLKMAIAFIYIDYKVNLVKNGDYILRYKHIAPLSSKLCILI